MDTPNPSAIPTAASRAPVHIGAVGMMVRDLDRVTAYYRDMLGLTVQEHTRQVAILGVGGVALLELIHRPDALPDDPREAGLYHTAFLMPMRNPSGALGYVAVAGSISRMIASMSSGSVFWKINSPSRRHFSRDRSE